MRYKKWLFWGGILGTATGLMLGYLEKRKVKASPARCRIIRNKASKTMTDLRASLMKKKKWE